MRRKDRKMDEDFGLYVIDQSDYGSLAIQDDRDIYNIPLSMVRDGTKLYFHSAKSGRKVQLYEENPRAYISFVTDIKIPEVFTKEELDELKEDESKGILFISRVFTTEFASALVEGDISLVDREDEKIEALRLICEKYTPSKMEYFDIAISSGLDNVNIYSITIDEISAKRKRYDSQGEEMK